MNKIEFKAELRRELEKNKINGIEEILDYYDEMISDRIENGEDESEIIKNLNAFSISSGLETKNEQEKEGKEKSTFINKSIPLPKKFTVKINNARIFVEKSADENFYLCYYNYKLKSYEIENLPNGEVVFCDKKKNLWQIIASTFSFFETFHHEPVRIFIPENTTCEVVMGSSNGRITLNGVTSKSISAKTSNGRVIVNGVRSESLFATSSNGKVIINNVNSANIDVKTSNGRIIGENIVSEDIKLNSSNGRVQVKKLNSNSVNASTSNGRVMLDLLFKMEESKINASTSNGSIIVNGEKYGNSLLNMSGEKNLCATSSNGSILLDFAK